MDETLEVINLEHDELYKAYAIVCSKLRDLLGSDDIIQLWKNIAWSKKDKCIETQDWVLSIFSGQ